MHLTIQVPKGLTPYGLLTIATSMQHDNTPQNILLLRPRCKSLRSTSGVSQMSVSIVSRPSGACNGACIETMLERRAASEPIHIGRFQFEQRYKNRIPNKIPPRLRAQALDLFELVKRQLSFQMLSATLPTADSLPELEPLLWQSIACPTTPADLTRKKKEMISVTITETKT